MSVEGDTSSEVISLGPSMKGRRGEERKDDSSAGQGVEKGRVLSSSYAWLNDNAEKGRFPLQIRLQIGGLLHGMQLGDDSIYWA